MKRYSPKCLINDDETEINPEMYEYKNGTHVRFNDHLDIVKSKDEQIQKLAELLELHHEMQMANDALYHYVTGTSLYEQTEEAIKKVRG